MFAPAVPELMKEFRSTNQELGTFVVSVYILGFAAGPMVLAPLSEMYGRLPVYHFSNLGFLVFTVACALSKNMNMLIGVRFFAGLFGSTPLTNGGGTVADIVRQEHRGLAMSTMVVGPLIGPVIGPIAGGYLSQAKGWRWVFWVLAMISGFFTTLAFVFMRETYAVVLLDRKTRRLQKETSNMALRSKLDHGLSPRDFFLKSIVRPTKMLFLSPIVLATSLYIGLVYGYLYLLFTTFTLVFEGQYGFSSGSVGLTYLGIGIGSLVGLVLFGMASDRMLKSKTKPNADGTPGEMKPEYRLPPMVPGAFLIPIGLFIYGWTAYYKVHYIVPILGTLLIGVGNLAVFMCISTYLVDAFTIHAASALAANTVVRSLLGTVLPLAGPKMYKSIGLGWGNSLLAFIALLACPIPIFFNWKGEWLRKRFDITGKV
jgi:multidrug resistance protein